MIWNDRSHHTLLRHLVCEHLKTHASRYEGFVIGDTGYNAYVRNMKKTTTWGDHITLAACASVLDRTIVVCDGSNTLIEAVPIDSTGGELGPDVWLAYLPEQHYRATRESMDDSDGDGAGGGQPARAGRKRLGMMAWLRNAFGVKEGATAATAGSAASVEYEPTSDEDRITEDIWKGSLSGSLSPRTIQHRKRIAAEWEKFVDENARKEWAKNAGLWDATRGVPCPYPANGVPDVTDDTMKDPPVMTRFLRYYYASHRGMYGHDRPGLATMESTEIATRSVLGSKCSWSRRTGRSDFESMGPSIRKKRTGVRGSQDRDSAWGTSDALSKLILTRPWRRGGQRVELIHMHRA
jgi:hypothetical protein